MDHFEPFKSRPTATKFLRDCGVPLGSNALADMAYDGNGPKYTVINGRALYRESDLLKWLENQAAKAAPRHRAKSADAPKRKVPKTRRRLESAATA